MVTFAGLLDPLYEPFPEPVQEEKRYPGSAVAEICTDWPALYQPFGGETLPGPEEDMVSRC